MKKQKTIPCPKCGKDLNVKYREAITDGRTEWWASAKCKNCGFSNEGPIIGAPD